MERADMCTLRMWPMYVYTYAVAIYWIVRSFVCGTKAYTPPAGLKRADMWRTNLKVG